MAAKKKSAARKPTKNNAVKARKPAAKKVATKKVARKTVARAAALPPAVIELDRRIAILRDNLRELTEQAAASSGASTEELLSDRISDREAQLRLLIAERDELVRRGS